MVDPVGSSGGRFLGLCRELVVDQFGNIDSGGCSWVSKRSFEPRPLDDVFCCIGPCVFTLHI
jgi:hypothetical protein